MDNPSAEIECETPDWKSLPLASRPPFYLVYLVFFFVPWLSHLPETREILLSLLIIAIFIPVHFLSFSKTGTMALVLIAVTEGFAILVAPLAAMGGVFHIYACAQAGYQRSSLFSTGLFLGLTFIYILASFAFKLHFFEIGIAIFIGSIVWLSCLAEHEKFKRDAERARSHELEKQQASITERERIARDLHDLLGHTLTMVSLKSDLAEKLIDTDPEKARAEILDIQASTRGAMRDIRAAISGMTAMSLSTELDNARAALRSGKINLEIEGDIPELSVDTENIAALAIRESITNVIKHSNARNVWIRFGTDDLNNLVHIEDDGDGGISEEGRGLSGLRARIQLAGGKTIINSVDGVRIALSLPKAAT